MGPHGTPWDPTGPPHVQERVLAGAISWPTGREAQHISPIAADLISRLLTLPPKERLGSRGAFEVRRYAHQLTNAKCQMTDDERLAAVNFLMRAYDARAQS